MLSKTKNTCGNVSAQERHSLEKHIEIVWGNKPKEKEKMNIKEREEEREREREGERERERKI